MNIRACGILLLSLTTIINAMHKYLPLPKSTKHAQKIDWQPLLQEAGPANQMLNWKLIPEESESEETCELLEEREINARTADHSDFGILPKEIVASIFLQLTTKDFLTLRCADTIRNSICSEFLVPCFLLETRYTANNYLKNIPTESQAKLDLNMLLHIATNTGYVHDLRILLGIPSVFNHLADKERAYNILSSAVLAKQVNVVKLLLACKDILQDLTLDDLQAIQKMNTNKKIKRLIKKQKHSPYIISRA